MLEENYRRVLAEIAAAASRSGRDPGSVKLIAVTKTVGVAEVRRAVALGMMDFGENRAREAVEKVKTLSACRWHFIGHLQTNKVKDVLPHYFLVHSLDRFSLASALQKHAERIDCRVDTLVQVNLSGEQSKSGLSPGELLPFLSETAGFDRVRVRGLMTMAPYLENEEDTRPLFRGLRLLRDEAESGGFKLPELSMGMTNDYRVAVEEGATMVRIGSALFG